jgi:hypothetical protein
MALGTVLESGGERSPHPLPAALPPHSLGRPLPARDAGLGYWYFSRGRFRSDCPAAPLHPSRRCLPVRGFRVVPPRVPLPVPLRALGAGQSVREPGSPPRRQLNSQEVPFPGGTVPVRAGSSCPKSTASPHPGRQIAPCPTPEDAKPPRPAYRAGDPLAGGWGEGRSPHCSYNPKFMEIEPTPTDLRQCTSPDRNSSRRPRSGIHAPAETGR